MEKERFILTLDEGTTSARAIIFDRFGHSRAVAQHEFTQIFPQPGYVEHDAVEIFSAQYTAASEAIITAGIDPTQIAAIGITNQRETTVVWDKTTGEPIYNAIVWQCRRTAPLCEQLIADGMEPYIKQVTGLKPDAYFSATKIRWILDHVEGAQERAEKGELLFGTIDCWLLWKLSGGKIHATDYTNAARTMLFDIHRCCWDTKMLEKLNIPECMLPQVFPSGHYFGDVQLMGATIPVCGMAGDQQAALFGQRCFKKGQIKNTYGTGCFLLMNTGDEPIQSQNGLVTTLAASTEGQPPQYALEGSVFVGGAVIQWLRDELQFITKAAESEACATAVADNGGVYIVPAFAGLGAPYWDMYASGTICGLTRGSNRNHIIRAALESIAYQTDDLIRAMRADSNADVFAVKADGGAANNAFLMQFQADISNLAVVKPDNAEATALGAAFLAGLTAGLWADTDALERLEAAAVTYTPTFDQDKRENLLDGWRRAVRSTMAFPPRPMAR
ncbi:MAG: glycerol kinase GlpK [Clostridia bacterium]|nr:glycerol kinase GlpK [Clostridia bacterium]